MKKNILACLILVLVTLSSNTIKAESENCINIMGGLGSYGLRYEKATEAKKTIGGFLNILNIDNGSAKVEGFGLDLSMSSYSDKLFVGPYNRLGVRYAKVDGENSTSKASANLIVPYALVGYNFGIENIIIGAGLGVGYGFGSVEGDSDVKMSLDGLQLLLDLNLGFHF